MVIEIILGLNRFSAGNLLLVSIELASSKFRDFDFFKGSGKKKMAKEEEFIYRISTDQEWEEFQKKGSSFGGDLDKSTGYYHLSKLDQVFEFL